MYSSDKRLVFIALVLFLGPYLCGCKSTHRLRYEETAYRESCYPLVATRATISRECATTFTSEEAKRYVAAIPADSIKIQAIHGVNAVLLLQAIEAALGDTGFDVDKKTARSVLGDEVTVTTSWQQVANKGFHARHRIIAKTESGNKQITISVETQTAFFDEGVPGSSPDPGELPKEVHQRLVMSLQTNRS